MLSSIYGTLGASLIGVPVGLLTAVFLSKAAAPGAVSYTHLVPRGREPAARTALKDYLEKQFR